MSHNFAIWVRRAAATALFASAFFIVVAGYIIISNAPESYTGSGDFSDEDRIAIAHLSLYIIAILLGLFVLVVCFSVFRGGSTISDGAVSGMSA